MPRHIRAKFRVMSVTEDYDRRWAYKLAPVYKNSGGNHEENKLFWSFTPSGELNLHAPSNRPLSLEAGALYYIDLHDTVESDVSRLDWRLTASKKSETGGSVELSREWQDGSAITSGWLNMGLTVPGTLALFGEPGGMWALTISPAEES